MSDIVIRLGGDRPRAVFDPHGPGGEPIQTPSDHRLLWWLRHELAGAPESMRHAFDVLNEYLKDNCQHHWREYLECCTPPKDDCSPPHRQCLWCYEVEPIAGPNKPRVEPHVDDTGSSGTCRERVGKDGTVIGGDGRGFVR